MKNKLRFFIGLCCWLVSWAWCVAGEAEKTQVQVGWRLDFTLPENAVSGSYNNSWEAGGTKIGVPEPTYTVVKNTDAATGAVLQIKSDKATGALMCKGNVDLNKYPIMRWKWRVIMLPAGADGRKPETDDQAISLYIGARNFLSNKSVCYRWETETPVGASGLVTYGGGLVKVKYFSLRNKDTAAGEWVTESRNVRDDFKAAYGYVPDEFAFSVGANSQYTKTNTVAELEYVEFVTE